MSAPFTVRQARPSRQPKPFYFRTKPTARGARAITRINAGSHVIPRTKGVGRKSAKDEEPAGSQRWLAMIDESGEDGEYEDLVLEVVPETNEYIASILEPVNFISVMGPTRSGKSTLMNLLAECLEHELFPTANGGIPFTKGMNELILLIELRLQSADGRFVYRYRYREQDHDGGGVL